MRNRYPEIKAEAEKPMVMAVADVAIEAVAGEKGEKKRPTFTINAYNGGMIRVGYYGASVIDLKGLRAAGTIPVLLDHNSTLIVGQGKAKITGDGVTVNGTITGDCEDKNEPAGKVVMHAKGGFSWSASVGVSPEKIDFIGSDQKVKVNGQEFTGPIYVCRAGRLGEVSFVAVGADETATASIAATAAGKVTMTFEQWLQARGLTLEKLSDTQQAALRASFDVEIKAGIVQPTANPTDRSEDTVPPEAPVHTTATVDIKAQIAEIRKAIASETKRVAEIQKVCAGKNAVIEAQAIEDGWTEEKTELAVLRASRPHAPNVNTGSSGGIAVGTVLEAAACMAGKLETVEKIYKPEVLEASSKRFRNGIGLQELFLEAAWANGYPGRTFRGDPIGVLRAAFSSMDISGILSNVANKFLLEGFMGVENTWQQIAATRPVSDFKTVTSYRLTGGFEYQKVAPTGELKHATAGNESFTNKADTYGIMFSITRQDQINDDMGALTAVPRRIGRGGALALNSVFWTEFMSNAEFFATENKNYAAGAGTALGIDSLTAAELLFLNQTDSDGKPLSVAPEILLTANANSTKATSLSRDLEIRDTTGNNTTGNPHAGKFRPVRSSYLSNSKIAGNSALAWYLLANPSVLAAIEVAFLNGQQNPTVETADADFNVLGVQMRGYHDFGVSKQDHRAGVKMKGEA